MFMHISSHAGFNYCKCGKEIISLCLAGRKGRTCPRDHPRLGRMNKEIREGVVESP